MIREKENPTLQTPMMRQYLAVKEKHPREILFFRMGDFYETFFDDARLSSDILGITLTSRSKDKEAIPMAGVPVRAADSYVARLLKAGKRVAICEQVEDPKEAAGLVDRDVVRVISPGTITDEKIVGEKSHNYIISVVVDQGNFGLAWLDVTTGQFLVWESSSESAIGASISKLDPAECLLPDSLDFTLDRHPQIEAALENVVRTPFPDPLFQHEAAFKCLTEHFGTKTLEGFGCDQMRFGVRAGGGLLRYVSDTQKDALHHITKITPYEASRHVPLDRATRRALEITETYRGGERAGTLLSAMDKTCTAPGARLLREWILSPLTSVQEIVGRQDAVEEIRASQGLREAIAGLLGQIHDLERISTRISYRSANARDLVGLSKTLEIVPRIKELLGGCTSSFLRRAAERLVELEELRTAIAAALVDSPPLYVKEGGLVRAGHDRELDELRDIAQQGTRWIARFQQQEIQRTAIPSLKVSFNKVFGYYIEITNTHKEKIPPDYIRKQTLKNCERFVTAELKDYETKVLSAKDRVLELEYEIFVRLRDQAAACIPALQTDAEALAEVDVILDFAALAVERGYKRPAINEGTRLFIENGRHPVVELLSAEPFVPNSVDVDVNRNIMIITGPNMAGKSTYIRQVALLTLLAQTGSYLPAGRAEIGIVDRIFTRVGAADDLARGQSTFMVEMQETANILNNATPRSLIILDEVGRGTSTFDGLSLAWAITEYIAEKIGARTLFATHYHELTELCITFPNVKNFNFSVKEWNEDIIFLRKIVEGGSDKSYGIHVARLAGIPHEVLERGKEILCNLESQAMDVHDQPAIAARNRTSKESSGAEEKPFRQLDLFQDANEKLLKELKRLDIDRMTPLEALQQLEKIKRRLV